MTLDTSPTRDTLESILDIGKILDIAQKKIIYELKSNGISSELINDNLSSFNDDYEVLFDLASTKIVKKRLEDQKILMKYVNQFKSRGFEDNIILKVINNIKHNEIQ